MKFKEYIEGLQELAKTNPEAYDLEVIFSKDDEGNGFNRVNFGPQLGSYCGERDGEFLVPEDQTGLKNNAVCIN